MGLCKCPKKRVTNLFCFVHRVNVCEDCMIRQHSRCIVQSYLQWLQDSDYDPVCLLCTKSLDSGDIVRLCCHDLFHVSCLDGYVQSRPNGATLPGMKCPRCKDDLFPSVHVVSPVADQLRHTLRHYWWGKEGLGLTISNNTEEVSFEDDEILTTEGIPSSHSLDSQLTATSTPLPSFPHHKETVLTREGERREDSSSTINHVTLELFNNSVEHHDYRHPVAMPTSTYHPPTSSSTRHYHGSGPEEDKYKRKNPLVALKRWFRSQQGYPFDDPSNSTMKRYLLIILLVCAGLVTVLILMTRVASRRAEDASHNFDWKHNPNIKTGQ